MTDQTSNLVTALREARETLDGLDAATFDGPPAASLYLRAADWIDRASALLPLIPRDVGTDLAREVSALLSLQQPSPRSAHETSGNTDLQWLDEWLAAYPLDVFPLPDFRQAADVLRKAGLSIDCISAANYRHVLNRVKERISAVETAPLPLGFVTIEECAGCGVRDRPNARHTDICPAAAGELVRPVKASEPLCGVTSVLDTKCDLPAGHGGRHRFPKNGTGKL